MKTKQYELFYGSFGNGISISNSKHEKNGDFEKIAHISYNRTITWYDSNLPADLKKEIEDYAQKGNPQISATQLNSVFKQNIQVGDMVTIYCQKTSRTGKVNTIQHFGADSGYYIEMTTSSGCACYWKQGVDGGYVEKVL
jgi:DNA phosphorothioation-dependent restriction protein DptG